jgi:4-amino-4-deoxy-L-arabinose transferase-like glycosyltransferase
MKSFIQFQKNSSGTFNFIFSVSIVGFIFLGLWPYLHIPLTDNEGVFAYIGQELSSGAKLYQDVWDHKPPLLFIHFLLLKKIGGDEEAFLHIYAALIHCVNALLLFWLGKRWLGDRSWWCAITYVVLILPPFFQCWTPQAEFLMEPFLLGGLLAVNGKKPWRWLLGGCLFACGFFTKQSFIFYLPLFFLGNAFAGPLEALYFFAGMDLMALLTVLPFMLDGRLNELWYAIWGFNRFYVENGWTWFSYHPEFRNGLVLWLIKVAEVYGLFFLAAFYFIVNRVVKNVNKKESKESPFLICWLISSLTMVVTSGYFFPYYSVVLILPLSVLTPIVFVELQKKHSLPVLLLIVFLVTGPLVSWLTVCHSGTDALEWSGYLKVHNVAAREMGEYLKSIAKPGDQLLAWSMEPQIYVYSSLSASNYIKTPLVNHLRIMPNVELKAKEAFLKSPPRFVVISHYDQVNSPPSWLMEDVARNRKLFYSIGKLELFTFRK